MAMTTWPVVVQILSGAVVASGEMKAEITSIGAKTFFGKTIALLGAPEEKGHLFKVPADALSSSLRFSFWPISSLCTDAAITQPLLSVLWRSMCLAGHLALRRLLYTATAKGVQLKWIHLFF